MWKIKLAVLTSMVLLTTTALSTVASAENEEPSLDRLFEKPKGQAAWSWPNCTYESKIDHPHLSSSNPNHASVHGYWIKTGGSCTTATVTTQLQAYLCSDPWGHNCGWTTVAKSIRSGVRPGGGSGKRATAQAPCVSNRNAHWRGVVDVDIDGQWDGGRKEVSAVISFACAVTV